MSKWRAEQLFKFINKLHLQLSEGFNMKIFKQINICERFFRGRIESMKTITSNLKICNFLSKKFFWKIDSDGSCLLFVWKKAV